jgi:acetylglutamate kinase
MRVVIKLGGRALDSKDLVRKFAQTIADVASSGHQVAVIHGGGAAVSRTLKELGKESQFINGLRVTDSATRDVALMVLAGQLNKELVAAVGAAGQNAIGLCGGDLGMFRATRRSGQPELGFVGDISYVESRWLEVMWQNNIVPIISSIALGTDGEYYNINADHMASACASACNADALVFLTDVAGVKGADGAVIRWLHVHSIHDMVQDSVISGGMLPKLEACTHALKRGVSRVRILPAESVDVLPGFFTSKIECGTEVIP